jgi:hypothetical protein
VQSDDSPEFDASIAHPARIYNYWLGGKDNYAADRAAGNRVIELRPEIIAGVRANRRFLGRAVRYLAEQEGIRQFLDVGTGLPCAGDTHEVAQDVAPEARVVYVDNDPMVLAHGRALLTGSPEGATAYVGADLRDVGKVLGEAAKTLDLTKPVALMFLMTLMYIPDADDPHAIVSRYMDGLAPGSFLVVSDTTIENHDAVLAESARLMNEELAGRFTQTRRSPAEVLRYFDGLELVEPGLTALNRWRLGPDDATGREIVTSRCAVARKP